MDSKLGHLQINIKAGNLGFYKDLLGFLEWPTVYEGDGMFGVAGKNGDSLWFSESANDAKNDYDGVGMNHLGFAVSSQAEVDQAAGYLQKNGIAALFGTPCHRPDFASGESDTYYQVMFATPDNLLVEVVYTGPKQ
ncbi:MAG: hypothetical protein ABI577_01175 [bacterium]